MIHIDEFIELLCDYSGHDQDKQKVTPDFLIEEDFGITGDDGVELLEFIEKAYTVKFPQDESQFRALFGLSANEYLFHSEGLSIVDIFPFLRNRKSKKVVSISVKQLYDVVCKLKQ